MIQAHDTSLFCFVFLLFLWVGPSFQEIKRNKRQRQWGVKSKLVPCRWCLCLIGELQPELGWQLHWEALGGWSGRQRLTWVRCLVVGVSSACWYRAGDKDGGGWGHEDKMLPQVICYLSDEAWSGRDGACSKSMCFPYLCNPVPFKWLVLAEVKSQILCCYFSDPDMNVETRSSAFSAVLLNHGWATSRYPHHYVLAKRKHISWASVPGPVLVTCDAIGLPLPAVTARVLECGRAGEETTPGVLDRGLGCGFSCGSSQELSIKRTPHKMHSPKMHSSISLPLSLLPLLSSLAL